MAIESDSSTRIRDEVIQRIHQTYNEVKTTIRVSPTFLALRVFDFYSGPGYELHLAYASLEHLKAMARRELGRVHDPVDKEKEAYDRGQSDMFGELLQDRYPIRIKRGQEPQYVLRAFLSKADRDFNVQRMRNVGGKLLRHADALEAEGMEADANSLAEAVET